MNVSNFKDKIDELKQNPGLFFGLLYPYILVIILGIGLYYLTNEANIAQQNIPPLTSPPVHFADLIVQQPKVIPPVDVNHISVPTPELIEMGSKLYKSTCAACHGNEGTGEGPGSTGLNPSPRNFTVHDGWKNGEKIAGIYASLQDGIANSGMIAYDFLTPEEKFSLAHYIRSEFIDDPPMDDEMDLLGLDILYDLSAGLKVAGQMPTESALQLIAENSSQKFVRVTKAIENININSNSRASHLLNNVTDDLYLALSALANSNKWKESEDSFIRFLTVNVNQNGFNGKIFNLSADQWNALYNYLNNFL